MLVVGNARSLAVDERWRNLVASALERGMAWQALKPFDEFVTKVGALGRGGRLDGRMHCGGGGRSFMWARWLSGTRRRVAVLESAAGPRFAAGAPL